VKFKTGITFDDVLLVPQYSEIESRSSIDLSVKGSLISLSLPIISSPMDTVTESKMAIAMCENGGTGIIHRYNSIDQQLKMVEKAVKSGARNVGAAVGVSGDYIDRAVKCVYAGANIVCVDIAHGHHSLMRHALRVLKNTFGTSVHIMAGNVATRKGFDDLVDWGADSVRVGIGGGSICSTRIQTGHGVPTLQSILDCSISDRDALIIADGGIRNSGDIVKAISAGADLVMLGSLLAGTTESPGEIYYIDGEKYKAYRGMASIESQIMWRGHASSVEGVSSKIPFKGPCDLILNNLSKGIRSGLSYSGCTEIKEFQSKSQMIMQTAAGQYESSTHVYSRGLKN